MAEPFDVAVLVGSLRKESFTRKIAKAMIGLAPQTLRPQIVEIGELALYNEDLEANPPQPWVAFRDRIRRADAVLFATPEYNRSVPAALKNAVDVGSRPYGQSVWNAKPSAVVSVSPGAIGGFGANNCLRQSFVFLNMPPLQREAYIGGVTKLLNEQGELVNDSTRTFLEDYMRAFADWIATQRKG
jgi:chromate reductase